MFPILLLLFLLILLPLFSILMTVILILDGGGRGRKVGLATSTALRQAAGLATSYCGSKYKHRKVGFALTVFTSRSCRIGGGVCC